MNSIKLERLPYDLTVCKITDIKYLPFEEDFFFIGKTDEEISLVCKTESVPENVTEREEGWRAFRICGVLDFSLVGILAPIVDLLAENKIGIFAVSTFNTDYVLVKEENFDNACDILKNSGYLFI